MTAPHDVQTLSAPSLSTLARTTVIALVVAAAILVAFVLPAEYAIDPIGIGRWLGLTDIAAPKIATVELPKADGAPMAPTTNGPIGEYPKEFKFDVYDVVLQPYEYVEYKYQLEKGATMLYAWTASAGVLHDFHGEHPAEGSAEPVAESFDTQDRRQSAGSYTATFTGIHGWYWENPGAEPITIRLTSAGFYTGALEIHSDHTRQTRTLRSLDSLAAQPTRAATGNQ